MRQIRIQFARCRESYRCNWIWGEWKVETGNAHDEGGAEKRGVENAGEERRGQQGVCKGARGLAPPTAAR